MTARYLDDKITREAYNNKYSEFSKNWTNARQRMEIAKELLHRVVEEARNYGCGTIQITASDMGVKLYSDFQ